MTEPSDFIDVDMFDPDVLEAQEKAAKLDNEASQDDVRASLERRRRAYAVVFSKGHTDQVDIDIVLKDLMWFCRAWYSTFNPNEGPHAAKLADMKEGRREVLIRILDHTELDKDTLFLKYTTPK